MPALPTMAKSIVNPFAPLLKVSARADKVPSESNPGTILRATVLKKCLTGVRDLVMALQLMPHEWLPYAGDAEADVADVHRVISETMDTAAKAIGVSRDCGE